MAKLKTHKGAAKRFRVTAKGKLKHRRAGLRHLLFQEDSGAKRQRRSLGYLAAPDQARLSPLLPYQA